MVAIAVTVLVDIVFPEQNHIGHIGLHAVGGGENVVPVDQGTSAEIEVVGVTERRIGIGIFLSEKIHLLLSDDI